MPVFRRSVLRSFAVTAVRVPERFGNLKVRDGERREHCPSILGRTSLTFCPVGQLGMGAGPPPRGVMAPGHDARCGPAEADARATHDFHAGRAYRLVARGYDARTHRTATGRDGEASR